MLAVQLRATIKFLMQNNESEADVLNSKYLGVSSYNSYNDKFSLIRVSWF